MNFNQNMKKHITNLNEEDINTIQLQRTDQLPQNLCEIITNKVKVALDCKSLGDAYIRLSILCQQGGTARKCDGNLAINYKGITFKLATIRKIFQEQGAKGGLRKFARTTADLIYATCNINKKPIIGNLANKIKRNNPGMEFKSSEEVWMSDFQATNPSSRNKKTYSR